LILQPFSIIYRTQGDIYFGVKLTATSVTWSVLAGNNRTDCFWTPLRGCESDAMSSWHCL